MGDMRDHIEELEAKIFDSEWHYDILKESYDDLLIFMAEELEITKEEVFDAFLEWRSK